MRLSPLEFVARARADMRVGVPVAVADGAAGAVVISAETAPASRLKEIAGLAGELDLAVTNRRAATLKVPAYDGDLARLALPPGDLGHVPAIADPALALARPLIGPFRARREGDAEPHRLGIRLAKAARLLPAVVVWPMGREDAARLASNGDLTFVDRGMLDAADEAAIDLTCVSSARVPLAVSNEGRVHVWRPVGGEEEHYAVEIGAPDRDRPVLSRLHSACFTGDVIGSLKCDCGPQLKAALRQIAAEGAGVILYLNQEGRGIGLANKMRAYSLQDEGFDTVDANHRLGFEDDERDFRLGTEILRRMGFSAVRLMTNNPGKVAAMEAAGLRVAERVPLVVGENAHNVAYLETKARKSGHLL